jgi:hypothetical protein
MKEERDVPVPEQKLAYEKPAFTWEEALAIQPSLMAGCQKVGANPPDCDTNPAS